MDTKQLSHYIDGQWVQAAAASDSLNPSDTREVVARVPGGDKSTVNAAVAAAKAAFPAWANASPEVRSDLLDKVGSLIMARADELGRLLSREEGKTFPEGKGEVMRAARIFKSRTLAQEACVAGHVRINGLGGAMMWSLDGDDERATLTRTIDAGLWTPGS